MDRRERICEQKLIQLGSHWVLRNVPFWWLRQESSQSWLMTPPPLFMNIIMPQLLYWA